MGDLHTATPATAICEEPAPNFEQQLPGRLKETATTAKRLRQVAFIRDHAAVSESVAEALAPLLFLDDEEGTQ